MLPMRAIDDSATIDPFFTTHQIFSDFSEESQKQFRSACEKLFATHEESKSDEPLEDDSATLEKLVEQANFQATALNELKAAIATGASITECSHRSQRALRQAAELLLTLEHCNILYFKIAQAHDSRESSTELQSVAKFISDTAKLCIDTHTQLLSDFPGIFTTHIKDRAHELMLRLQNARKKANAEEAQILLQAYFRLYDLACGKNSYDSLPFLRTLESELEKEALVDAVAPDVLETEPDSLEAIPVEASLEAPSLSNDEAEVSTVTSDDQTQFFLKLRLRNFILESMKTPLSSIETEIETSAKLAIPPLSETPLDPLLNVVHKRQGNLFIHPDAHPIDSLSRHVSIGDLHGNALKLIFTLIQESFLTLENGAKDYDELVRIYKKFYTLSITEETKAEIQADLHSFRTILDRATCSNTRALTLIGDEFADRGSNDYLTLLVFNKLSKSDLETTVILSNHGIDFLSDFEKERFTGSSKIAGEDGASLKRMKELIDAELIDESEVRQMVSDAYIPMVKLFGYTVSPDRKNITLFSHAPVGFETIQAVAEKWGIPYNESSVDDLIDTIDAINAYMHQLLANKKLGDTASIEEKEILASSALTELYKDPFYSHVTTAQPFYRTLWNRHFNSVQLKPTYAYSVHAVHGHCGAGGNVHNRTNLDTGFGKQETKEDGRILWCNYLPKDARSRILVRHSQEMTSKQYQQALLSKTDSFEASIPSTVVPAAPLSSDLAEKNDTKTHSTSESPAGPKLSLNAPQSAQASFKPDQTEATKKLVTTTTEISLTANRTNKGLGFRLGGIEFFKSKKYSQSELIDKCQKLIDEQKEETTKKSMNTTYFRDANGKKTDIKRIKFTVLELFVEELNETPNEIFSKAELEAQMKDAIQESVKILTLVMSDEKWTELSALIDSGRTRDILNFIKLAPESVTGRERSWSAPAAF